MPNKSTELALLKPGQLIGTKKANELINFYNAFMKLAVVTGSSNAVHIGDKNIILQIKTGNTNTGAQGGPVWLP